MRIDPSVYQAIDDGAITLDQMIATLEPAWDKIEPTLFATLDKIAADAIASGFAEADVRPMIEEQRRRLRERTRPAWLEMIRQMIECRVTRLH